MNMIIESKENPYEEMAEKFELMRELSEELGCTIFWSQKEGIKIVLENLD